MLWEPYFCNTQLVLMVKWSFRITVFLSCIILNEVSAQTIEDRTLGPKPTLKIESLSPAGHCDNQQLTFFAPWADHYELFKRRSDTGWIKENKPTNTWSSQMLKPGVTGMIYKKLDEQGTFQFVVKAYKGNNYRVSDTITRQPCMP